MKRSSLHSITSAVAAALFLVACSVPAAAQERMQDRPRDEGMRGNRSFGTGIGIDIGIGILQGLTRPPAGQNPPANDTSQSHKTDAKTPKRAGKKDDKVPPQAPKQQTTDKPPPTPPVVTTPPPAPPPSTVATSPPPGAPPPAKVENPPTNTPSPPQPVTPSIQATTKTDDVCPQRGRGCVALLIDFRKYAFVNGLSDFEEPDELGAAEELLGRIQCKVERVSPEFKRTTSWTRKYFIGTAGQNIKIWTSQNDPDGTEEAHNKAELEKINAAIAGHREKVKALQPETAIEMVSGHGNGSGSPFGNWSAHTEWAKNHIERGSFHVGNYQAVKHNVCSWFVYDSSCYSGNTPKAVDLLNNTGQAETSTYDKPPDTCPLHAGYEADVAVGTSTEDTCANVSDGPNLLDKTVFLSLLETELLNRMTEAGGQGMGAPPRVAARLPKEIKVTHSNDGKVAVVSPSLAQLLARDAGEFPSSYSDKGYHYCGVPERKGMTYKTPTLPSASSEAAPQSR